MSGQGLPDTGEVIVEERAVLEKFEGEALPENIAERIYFLNGDIVKWERYEDGEVVEESDTYGGELNGTN
jgi:hypothetical protein